MKNKLTPAEIQRVFAMYLGHNVVHLDKIYSLKGLDSDSIVLNTGNIGRKGVIGLSPMGAGKLLLIPLDKLTDEHAIGIADLSNQQSYPDKVWLGKRITTMLDSSGGNRHFAYQQLILWGYAVPLYFGIDHWANGQTAIELGIAIDKTL